MELFARIDINIHQLFYYYTCGQEAVKNYYTKIIESNKYDNTYKFIAEEYREEIIRKEIKISNDLWCGDCEIDRSKFYPSDHC